jgi:hypothetical protein
MWRNPKTVSTLTMKAMCSSETLVITFKITRLHNPEDLIQHLNHREHVRSQNEAKDG